MGDQPRPSYKPTERPSYKPTYKPSYKPTKSPSYKPTDRPSYQPSYEPSYKPTDRPSYKPIHRPSYQPSHEPSYRPSYQPRPSYEPRPYRPHHRQERFFFPFAGGFGNAYGGGFPFGGYMPLNFDLSEAQSTSLLKVLLELKEVLSLRPRLRLVVKKRWKKRPKKNKLFLFMNIFYFL